MSRRLQALLFALITVALSMTVLPDRQVHAQGQESAAAAVIPPEKIDSTAGPVQEVMIQSFKYEPQQVTIQPGTTVVWTNSDPVVHNSHVTEGPGNIGQLNVATRLLGQGEKAAIIFNEPGTYTYICDPHPFMVATVVVSGQKKQTGSGTTESPAEGATNAR